LKVVIAIEEVWNKFLVSPVDFARYVDEFRSPWVRAYLDVGNMVFYGYPQDWIRIMGKRIAKLHIKDFRYRNGQTEWVALREGDIDWMEVYRALADIGYQGTATVELDSGDGAYLREVSRRFDLILSGA
jgi:hexulose-6-phosphate isomerase